MNMIKKMLIVPAVLALSVSFSQVSFAHEGMMKKHHAHHACMQEMMKKLDLTAAQKAKIHEIKMQHRKDIEPRWHEVRALSREMRGLVETDKMDDTKLTALIHKRKELMGEIYKHKMMCKHDMYNVLTAKQKAEYTKMSNHCDEMKLH